MLLQSHAAASRPHNGLQDQDQAENTALPIVPSGSSSGFDWSDNLRLGPALGDTLPNPHHHLGSPNQPGPGLPFRQTVIFTSLTDVEGHTIVPEICGSNNKGFFLADDGWTCYRRNYFNVKCSFRFESVPNGLLYVELDQHRSAVGQFHLQLTAKSIASQNSAPKPISLIQHTSARDKVTGTLLGFLEHATPSYQPTEVLTSEHRDRDRTRCLQINSPPGSTTVPISHEFDRLQFSTATANNGKRRAAQQYFQIVLALWCDVVEGSRVKIAERVSFPVVVRGRSPAHYVDDRRTTERFLPLASQLSSQSLLGRNLLQESTIIASNNKIPYSSTFQETTTDEGYQDYPSSNIAEFGTESISSERTTGTYQPERQRSNSPSQPLLGARDSINSVSNTLDNFDTSSISSGSETFTHGSTSTSATSLAESEDLTKLFVSALFRDTGIKNLCIDGFSRLNSDRFERHLRRTLKVFARDLIRSPTTTFHKIGYFLRRRIARVTRDIREQVHSLEASLEIESNIVKAIDTSQYDEKTGTQEYSSESDLEDIDPDYEEIENSIELTGVNDFASMVTSVMISSSAFREDLIDFVVPFMMDGAIVGKQMKVLQTRYSYRTSVAHPVASRFSSRSLENITRTSSSWAFRQLKSFASKLVYRWKRLRRPPIKPGYVRQEWICECGELIWGDFMDDTANDSAGRISKHPTHPQYHTGASAMPTTQQASAAATRSGPGHPVQPRPFGASTTLHVPIGIQRDLTHRQSVPATTRYLGLCINVAQYEIILAEIDVCPTGTIATDGELFREIRRYYNLARSKLFIHRFKLFKPGIVNYVQFCVADSMVGILQGPSSIPTDSKDYDFQPCPMKDPPPVPENLFLHLLTSEKPHHDDIWLSRLPKKRGTRFLAPQSTSYQDKKYVTGWGVHIIEVPNGDAIIWTTGIGVLFSLTIALIYIGVSRGDVQSAFAISAFLVASESALMFAFFHYHYAVWGVSKS